MLDTLRRWRPGGYLRASGSLLFWLVLRAAFQAGLVVLLARQLGAAGYGEFVAGLGIAAMFVPLTGLGLHAAILRAGAARPEQLPLLFGAALQACAGSIVVFGSLAVVAGWWVIGTAGFSLALASLILVEIASSTLVELVARVSQARNRVALYGGLQAGVSVVRLAGLGLAMPLFALDAERWMWIYAAVSLAYASALLAWYRSDYQLAAPAAVRRELLGQGRPFLLGALSSRIQADFNKPILATVNFGSVGTFSAAQRIVDVASLPLIALQEALWPRLFAQSAQPSTMLATSTLLLLTAGALGLSLHLIAPLVPKLLGRDFAESTDLLRMLAWLPILQTVRNLGNARLILHSRTRWLSASYIVGASTSILLTLTLARLDGARGVVVAAYGSEIAVIVLLAIGYIRGRRPG